MGIFKRNKYSGIIKWEELKNKGLTGSSYRAKIVGGWLFIIVRGNAQVNSSGASFIPDPEHKWDGSSID